MILSVSRRTDIPSFYSEWFMNRIKEGFVYVRNPFNAKHISKVKITPDVVDGIVFWSKDPKPLMKHLEELDSRGYAYYFQFTITGYGKEIEPNLRDKVEIIETFIELSEKLGKHRVILRYDPIFLTEKYTVDFHVGTFEKLVEKLGKYTEKTVISFIDDYRKVFRNMKNIKVKEFTEDDIYQLAEQFGKIANNRNLVVETCAERIDLENFGIKHGRCVDAELIERISKVKLKTPRLDEQRPACLCHQCIDIGEYDTCLHGCVYCYANVNKEAAVKNYKYHDPNSPILFGTYEEKDVKERKDVKSLVVKQERLL